MLSQETYKREKRRLATAQNRFNRAKRAVPNNPYSNELEGTGLAALQAAIDAARTLQRVALEGLVTFEREGYPDSWHSWTGARADAAFYLQRYELSPIGTK